MNTYYFFFKNICIYYFIYVNVVVLHVVKRMYDVSLLVQNKNKLHLNRL